MEIETVIRESQAEDLVEPLGFQTEVGNQQFSKQLRFFTANQESLRRRQDAILSLRQMITAESKADLDSLFEKAKSIEPNLKVFFTKSDVEKNSYEQLTFSSWAWAHIFNTFPFVLMLLSYFKLYVVPLLAILTPVFLIVMPYILLVYMYKLPITFSQYKDLMMGMMGLQANQGWTPRNMMQAGLTGFSVIQSMVQPVQNALHLQTVDKDLIIRGKAVEDLALIMEQIRRYIPMKNPLEDVAERCQMASDVHRSFAEVWDLPFRLQYALQLLGDAEVTYRIAICSARPAVYTEEPQIAFLNAYDPLLSKSIPFSVDFVQQGKHHALLTGPNKGGKSSFLRAVLLNVVLAQTFGFVFAHTCLMKPVHWIATGLKIEDRPGKSSLFEREVEFAIAIVKRAKQRPKELGLVLFDELFHSTNPPDGTRTATLFLEQLWKQKNVFSVISTHVFSIAKSAPELVKRLCVPALQKENGSLEFSYKLQHGICEVSSVDMILKEKGLLSG